MYTFQQCSKKIDIKEKTVKLKIKQRNIVFNILITAIFLIDYYLSLTLYYKEYQFVH